MEWFELLDIEQTIFREKVVEPLSLDYCHSFEVKSIFVGHRSDRDCTLVIRRL